MLQSCTANAPVNPDWKVFSCIQKQTWCKKNEIISCNTQYIVYGLQYTHFNVYKSYIERNDDLQVIKLLKL